MNQLISNTKILYGNNIVEGASTVFKKSGSKVFIISDLTMSKLGNIEKLTNVLKGVHMEYVVYSEINREPELSEVQRGSKLYQKENCDCIIALGGGAVIDAAKAIGVLVTKPNIPLEYYMGKEIDVNIPTIVAIPTTSGTGSEATQFAIITDERKKIKMLLKGECLIPSVAIVDASFTLSIPSPITITTGLDALCHSMESYLSMKAHPLSKQYSISALKKIFNALPLCVANGNDEEARSQMSLASLEAGIAFNNSSVTIIHGMSRPIGALFHIPHGLSNAILLLPCIKYILKYMEQQFGDLARDLGISLCQENEKAAQDFYVYIEEFLQQFKINDLIVGRIHKEEFVQQIPKMTTDAIASGSVSNLGFQIEASEIQKIYKCLICEL